MGASDGVMYVPDVEKQKYAVFLNMRDPVIIDAKGERADKVLEDNKDIVLKTQLLKVLTTSRLQPLAPSRFGQRLALPHPSM